MTNTKKWQQFMDGVEKDLAVSAGCATCDGTGKVVKTSRGGQQTAHWYGECPDCDNVAPEAEELYSREYGDRF